VPAFTGHAELQGLSVDRAGSGYVLIAVTNDNYVVSSEPIDVGLPIAYVRPSGSDSSDGSSWSLAKRTVQAGIDASLREVWVAGGTYAENVTLRNRIELYGGFDGTETRRDERGLDRIPVVLDGGTKASVITVLPAADHSIIDGFTIQHGRSVQGGGIACYAPSARISHNTIRLNVAQNATSPVSFGSVVPQHAEGGALFIVAMRHRLRTTSYGATTPSTRVGRSTAPRQAAHPSSATLSRTIPRAAGRSQSAFLCDTNSTGLILDNVFYYNYAIQHNRYDARSNCSYGNLTPNSIEEAPGNKADTDPQLADPGNPDPEQASFRLVGTSPCVDAGDGSVVTPGDLDLDGRPRIFGPAVDIGCLRIRASRLRHAIRRYSQPQGHGRPVRVTCHRHVSVEPGRSNDPAHHRP